MPRPSGSSSGHARPFVAIVALCVLYATIRYNVFAGVSWSEFPLFIANKGISIGAAVLLALAYLANRLVPADAHGRGSGRALARAAGLGGAGLAAAHTLVSFAALLPRRYPSLFDQGTLNDAGWVCLAAGTLALALFAIPAVYSFPRFLPALGPEHWRRAQSVGYLGLGLTALHVWSLGAHNWWDPSAWPGGLPPISLLSFIVCAAPIVVKVVSLRAPYRPRLGEPAVVEVRAK